MERDYVTDPEGPWRYLSDRVMGGVSKGAAEATGGAIRLSGTVSTENRGGFIQVRTELATPLDPAARGIALEARGNGERYFVHLRTRGTRLPWHYYQAGFATAPEWQEARLPFTSFRASGALLRGTPRPQDVTSIGLVAYGRDHEADLEVRSLWIW
ncbi:NADH ubiquinone oxidoreductase [Rhodovulum sp. 12E13]|nr:NADH ubiquinone oxidoreductase [Rhodovulum sp. 12E13]